MNITTAKKCNSRDAATATLRKIGIAKADYDDYICKKDGIFYVDTIGAEADVNDEKPVSAGGAREVDHAATNAAIANAMARKPVAKKMVIRAEDEAVLKAAADEALETAKKTIVAERHADTMDETELLEKKAKLKKMITPQAKPEKVAKAKRDPATVAPQRGEKETVAEATRRMLLEGKSNIEVWEELLKLFPNIDEKKKQFPAWYRFDMKRKGQLA